MARIWGFLFCLLISYYTNGASTLSPQKSMCGFNPGDIPIIKTASNQVPLLVAKDHWSPLTKSILKRRQLLSRQRFKKSIQFGPLKCPGHYKRAENILSRLVGSSHLTPHLSDLEIIMLCSKKDMEPISRNLSGHFLLIPRTLVEPGLSDDTVAAVLAHELAHSTLQHHARLFEQMGPPRPMNSDRRERLRLIKSKHEIEADLTGLQIMVAAGFNPQAAVQHVKTISQLRQEKSLVGDPDYGMDGLEISESAQKRMNRLKEQIRKCAYSTPL